MYHYYHGYLQYHEDYDEGVQHQDREYHPRHLLPRWLCLQEPEVGGVAALVEVIVQYFQFEWPDCSCCASSHQSGWWCKHFHQQWSLTNSSLTTQSLKSVGESSTPPFPDMVIRQEKTTQKQLLGLVCGKGGWQNLKRFRTILQVFFPNPIGRHNLL